MRRKWSTAVFLFLVLSLLVSCSGKEISPVPSAEAGSGAVIPSPGHKETSADNRIERQELLTFINTKLTGPFGVYTNLMDTDQTAEAASGHEVLSESASILMRADVLGGDKEGFASHWTLAKSIFSMEGGFSYRYTPKLHKQYPINAAVDDLRLIGALYDAGEALDEEIYTTEADQYSELFYQNNVKKGYMYDFYDNFYNTTNEFVTLCYINLSVLRKMSLSSELRDILLNNMSDILEEGYLSDQFPFYATRFNYKTETYSAEKVNTVESLLSILHLAEVDRQRPESIRYLKEQVEAGTLYGQYTREGQPANDIRSTAIYALTAMIGAEIGDESLYRRSIERMNGFRITDRRSPLYGGFGDPRSGQAYSFDNLMALLAYTYPF